MKNFDVTFFHIFWRYFFEDFLCYICAICFEDIFLLAFLPKTSFVAIDSYLFPVSSKTFFESPTLERNTFISVVKLFRQKSGNKPFIQKIVAKTSQEWQMLFSVNSCNKQTFITNKQTIHIAILLRKTSKFIPVLCICIVDRDCGIELFENVIKSGKFLGMVTYVQSRPSLMSLLT